MQDKGQKEPAARTIVEHSPGTNTCGHRSELVENAAQSPPTASQIPGFFAGALCFEGGGAKGLVLGTPTVSREGGGLAFRGGWE